MSSTLKPDSSFSLHTVSFLEFIDTSAGINQFLLARKEGVATAANIHFKNVSLFRGSRLECGTAGADNRYFVIFRMNIGFHNLSPRSKVLSCIRCFSIIAFFLLFVNCFCTNLRKIVAKFARISYTINMQALLRRANQGILMKIWQLLSPKNLTRADRETPPPAEGYAKVKITRALLSEADAAVYSGAQKVKYPVVPGRYAVGQVVETGADAYFNKGDRVYLADCVDNDETESGIEIAGETRDGYYRDFAYVSAQEAYVLPPSVSDDAAFLIDAVATAEKIADETGADVGRHVLVVGGGLYANVLCQILIWHRVVPVLADNNPERLALAKKCGIYYTFPYDDTLKENLLRITGGMLADAAVYFAFSNKSEPSRVFSLTRRGATAVFCSRTEKSLAVNLENAMKNDVSVKCVSDNRDYVSGAINVLLNKAVNYSEFTFNQSSEEALPAALERFSAGDASVLNEEFNIFKFIF